MTEHEQKELELFKEWFSKREFGFDKDIAEKAWLARSKLDKQTPNKTLGSGERSL